MDVRISSSYGIASRAASSSATGSVLARTSATSAPQQETLNLPVRQDSASPSSSNAPSRLVYQTQETQEQQIRRMSLFEQSDGRQFSRMETLTLTQQGARRDVVQQNPSGSVIRYEDILDQDSSGSLRRTQRFHDESGETKTTISAPSSSTAFPWTLEGAAQSLSFSASGTALSARGAYLDVQA